MDRAIEERLELARTLARSAGKATLEHFQRGVQVEIKPDSTPVTVADREAEGVIFDGVRAAFPTDGFLGEERGETPGCSGYRWIVDPIDGTKSFVQGVPLYGVMIAVEAGCEPVIGAVFIPGLDELVSAARGGPCDWNGKEARVSAVGTLEQACVAYTCLDDIERSGRGSAFQRVVSPARLTRGWGDCYGHLLVATGRVDVMLDPILSDWDCAALLPILEAAGGSFTDWSGRRTYQGKSGISTNGKLLESVLQRLGRDE